MAIKRAGLSLFILYSTLLQLCVALELQPVRPDQFSGQDWTLGKRETSALDFHSFESFLWEAPDGADLVLGNLTVYTPGDGENILSMEKFKPMLESVECSPNGMTLKFIDDETFAYAQRVWDWVNGADDHTFLMVTAAGDCGPDKPRVPYLVSSIQYDEELNSARLTATSGDWKNLVHAYELHVGKAATPPARRLKTRDLDESKAFSIASMFPFELKVEAGPLLGKLDCEDCGLAGSLNVDIHITFGIPDLIDSAVFRLEPKGIKAQAHPKLTIGAQHKKEFEWEVSVLPEPIPLYAITLADFMRLGVFNDVKVGVELTSFEGQISVQSGATATIPDTAFLEIDFKKIGPPKTSSWMPKIDVAPLKVTGQAAAGFQLYVLPELKLEASALNFGYEAALEVKAPYYEVKVGVEADPSGGVCEKKDVTAGLSVKGSWGAELKFAAGKLRGKDDIEVSIATLPLFESEPICVPLDEAKKPSPTSAAPSASKSKPPTSTPDSTPTCKANSGEKGTCVSTTSCKSLGGYSEAGHCPGDENVQCCTFPTGSGDTCTANGISGTCLPKSGCPKDTGVSIPGQCRGSTDIQCCISKEREDAAKEKNLCTIDKAGLKNSGFVGECISTGNCKRMGGTSTPGFCPGGDDIRCCTYGTCAKGVAGVCEPKSSCTGTTTPGLCGGGDNIQCCQQNFDSNHPGIQR